MILGYVSIGITLVIVLFLAIYRTVKPWVYYSGLYVVGGCLLLSTTLASSQLVGSDIHLEYYYASQSLQAGWDHTLACTVNSSLPVVWLAPAISKLTGIPLIWIFKVVFPLAFAAVPVLLCYVYSRFMPLKWAFLSAVFFIAVPVFFMELPQISRQMIAELFIAVMLACVFSNIDNRIKMTVLLAGSIGVIVSHWSTATFWFILLAALAVGYLWEKKKIQAVDILIILAVSVFTFLQYSHWASSGWQVVDYTNTINNTVAAVSQTVSDITQKADGAGTGLNLNINWLQTVTTLGLSFGIYRIMRSQTISKVYKSLVAACSLMLLANLFLPAISGTINYTRYYHLMLIILAPAFVMTFSKITVPLAADGFLIIFFITSGLVFNLIQPNSISKAGLPYSIALENKRLDAGNYLTDNDSKAAAWAKLNGYPYVYGDIGGALVTQDYYGVYGGLPLKETYQPGEIIMVREWNTTNGWSRWTGPGLRKTEKMDLPAGNKIFEIGKSYIWEVK